MKILITGGAGYIGSHVAKQILEKTKDELVILDNLSTGSEKTLKSLKKIRDFEFIKLDLSEFSKVKELIKNAYFDAIIHFAASIVVPESVENPIKYYMNNTVNTSNLIKYAEKFKVKKFIFSSTAAVYGEPSEVPKVGISEDFITKPINPYGQSKLMSEQILQDVSKASENLKFVIFRYFNVAGADAFYEDGNILSPRIGQSFPSATHLIKIASECAINARKKMYIFGDSYPTKDGTCVRDYIHVDDLSTAHIQALKYLELNPSDIFNIGYARGFSVKEVIKEVKKISKNDFKVELAPPRAGDPAFLIANNTKIKEKMSWVPKHDNLEQICKSALAWEEVLKKEKSNNSKAK